MVVLVFDEEEEEEDRSRASDSVATDPEFVGCGAGVRSHV